MRRISPSPRRWLDAVCDGRTGAAADDDGLRLLIGNRERQQKGAQSRLANSPAGSEPSAGMLSGYARDVLDGTMSMPKGRATRAPALLARQALEDTVRARCRAAGFDLDKATMRSRLIALRALVGDAEVDTADTADTAEAAWTGLSRACHQHAYELAPTTGEIRHLIDLVAALSPH